jgi:ferritin
MEIDKSMVDALNKQIQEELNSAYIYAAMAADCHEKNLQGAATWLEAQAGEELGHAQRFYRYILDREGRVEYSAVDKPKAEWGSVLEIFKAAYAHEQHISQCIYDLVDLARKQGDHASESFLNWFVNEQVEEEASALEVVRKLELVGDSKQGLYMIDRELGERGSNG